MTAAEIVDAAVDGPTLVFGSLPPAGADLDVLLRDDRAVADALASAGFVRRGRSEWARFRNATAEGVDVVTDWPHRDELLEAGLPLAGFENLRRPTPAHTLLLLAQLLRRSGRYPAKRVERMRAAVDEDARATVEARRLAPAWDVVSELERVLAGKPVERRPRPRRPRVVALSGIDGSGKSTQARALQSALSGLGYDVEIAWAPLGSSPLLRAVFLPLRDALGRLRSLQPTPAGDAESESGLVPNAGSVIRDRSPLAHRVWTTLMALANASFHARTAARVAAAGRVVIFDRYVLDSRVRLRFLYGRDRSYAVQDALVRLLSPRPLGAFFLDVSPRDSLGRKDDRWSERDLSTLVELYRELLRDDVTRLDGTRPAEALSTEIAEAVWLRLG